MNIKIHKKQLGGNVEYFMVDKDNPGCKVLWLYVDTLKDDDIKMWVSNLGVSYPIPKEVFESTFLDILIVSGLSEHLISSLYEELTFGTLVSFVQGNIHKKDHIFNVETLKDLMN